MDEAERLNARLELSRTYFDVGKRLSEDNRKYRAMNGIEGKEYLKKAEDLFREMNLQFDLDELDKIQSEIMDFPKYLYPEKNGP